MNTHLFSSVCTVYIHTVQNDSKLRNKKHHTTAPRPPASAREPISPGPSRGPRESAVGLSPHQLTGAGGSIAAKSPWTPGAWGPQPRAAALLSAGHRAVCWAKAGGAGWRADPPPRNTASASDQAAGVLQSGLGPQPRPPPLPCPYINPVRGGATPHMPTCRWGSARAGDWPTATQRGIAWWTSNPDLSDPPSRLPCSSPKHWAKEAGD